MTDRQGHHGADPARPRARFWLEVGLAVLSAVLAVTAAMVPDWIERTTGLHPDSGRGELEWLFALIPAVVAVGLGWAAHREWRRAVPA